MSLKNKLAIFDLDGTLFDTKDVNYNAYQNAIKMVEIDIIQNLFFNTMERNTT